VFYITDARTGHSWPFGAHGGIAVSVIREAPSVRDFILGLLARHSFNGPRGDGDRIDEDKIGAIIIEEYY
jgi:hypothetical protein